MTLKWIKLDALLEQKFKEQVEKAGTTVDQRERIKQHQLVLPHLLMEAGNLLPESLVRGLEKVSGNTVMSDVRPQPTSTAMSTLLVATKSRSKKEPIRASRKMHGGFHNRFGRVRAHSASHFPGIL